MTFRVATGLIAVATMAGAASAQVPWAPSFGGNAFFNYSQGRNSNTNLFGTPTLVGSQFAFQPNFVAGSSGTSASSATDQFNVRITALPGQHIAGIMIQEHGTWALTGAGSLQDSGAMFIQDLLNPRPSANNNMQYNVVSAGPPVPPTMPITTAGSGTWSGSAYIDLDAIIGPQWTDVMLIFTNTLQASTTGASSVGTITKKVADGVVVTVYVPAPGAGALLAAAGLLVSRRRRR